MKTPERGAWLHSLSLSVHVHYEMGHSSNVPWSPGLLVLLTKASSVPGSLQWLGGLSVSISFCDTHGRGLGITASQRLALRAPSPRGPHSPPSVPAAGICFLCCWSVDLFISLLGVTGKESVEETACCRGEQTSVCRSSWVPWPGAQHTRH